MAKKKKTLVCFLLDQTGSMLSVKEETILGFNKYRDELEEADKKTKFLLTKFNSLHIDIGEVTSIGKVPALTDDTYIPDHTTPLYDAIGRTIKTAEKKGEDMNVVITIMTDGLENASREFTRDGIFKLIESKRKDGWQFVFLGANQDAYAAGSAMGISRASTHTYDQAKTAETFTVAAASTARYMADTSKDIELTDEEKEEIT